MAELRPRCMQMKQTNAKRIGFKCGEQEKWKSKISNPSFRVDLSHFENRSQSPQYTVIVVIIIAYTIHNSITSHTFARSFIHSSSRKWSTLLMVQKSQIHSYTNQRISPQYEKPSSYSLTHHILHWLFPLFLSFFLYFRNFFWLFNGRSVFFFFFFVKVNQHLKLSPVKKNPSTQLNIE